MENKVEHIGFLVKSIEKTADVFKFLGYTAGEIFSDDIQRTRICFLTREGDAKIELVEPYPDNETMIRMQKKLGVSPYHVCYTTDDINNKYNTLLEQGFVPLFQPAPAIAFDNHRICYFWQKNIGYIEFVEK